jgi:alpha-galactosidase
VVIKHDNDCTIHDFKYKSHSVINGKPSLQGLPCTFGDDEKVQTLVVHLVDNASSIEADISYSIFPEHDAIVRSVKITNKGDKVISVEKLASFSVDFPCGDYDMVGLRGDWGRERNQFRRRVDYGSQG